MKISEMVELLENLRAEHGDLDCVTQTACHIFPPEIGVKHRRVSHLDGSPDGDEPVVLLNL